jgi:Uma2 family endonuclease
MTAAIQSTYVNTPLLALLNGKEDMVRFPASEKEYWDLVQLPEFRMDYNNDEIIAYMSYATQNHETIISNLIFLFRLAFEEALVLGSNRPVRVLSLEKNYQPDMQIIFGEPELYTYNKTMNATLNPSILVEVLSDSTKKYDRTEKLDGYKLIDSLQYMLFIDSNTSNIVLYSKTKKPNEWLTTTLTNLDDKLRLNGHSFLLKKIYQRVILNV